MIILGAGAFGTALAILLARHQQSVTLWSYQSADIAQLVATRRNVRYLPDFLLPANINFCADLAEIKNFRDILIAVPSYVFRETLLKIKPFFKPSMRVIWVTKGLDPQQHQFLHEVICEILGSDTSAAILSGPSFAKEVALGLPTAVAVASNNCQFSADLVRYFHCPEFRVYSCNDVIGVELGGVAKNALAIAVGIADGLQLGANARCALITRGFAEVLRLGQAVGAQQETLLGLAGMGDLILTCTDDQSRNRRVGLALGQGATKEQAQQQVGNVIEGIGNALQLYRLAQEHQVDAPIIEQIYRVLYENVKPIDAVNALMLRGINTEKS